MAVYEEWRVGVKSSNHVPEPETMGTNDSENLMGSMLIEIDRLGPGCLPDWKERIPAGCEKIEW